MKHWLGRTPRTVGDWLGLALGTALIFGGVAQLPALAAALGRLAVILRPFLWGLVLAYVLDIPTRWLAAKWFGGRRGAGAAVSYALLFGAAGLLLWLILPQLAQSVTSLFGKLAAYEETLRRLLAWVQATFGADTATMDAILQQLTARLQSEFTAWSGRAAQAAAKAASNTAGAAADAGIALPPASTCCWARKSCCTAPAFACGPPCRPGRWDSWSRSFSWRTELLVGTSAGSWWTHCWWAPRPLP